MKELSKAFKCSFCPKIYQLKHACGKHEKCCSKNPSNFRPCQECIFSETKRGDVYYGSDGRVMGVNMIIVKRKSIFLYLQKASNKGLAYETVDEENKLMPIKCEDQKLVDF